MSSAILDEASERRVRIHIPRSIAAFATPAAVTLLLKLMGGDKEGLVRYKALRGLGQLARETSLVIEVKPILEELKRNALEYLRLFSARVALEQETGSEPHLPVKLVLELLDDKIQQSFDRIARLLQLVQRGDDIRSIFSALTGADRRQSGRAVEFLDALIRGLGRDSDDVATLLRLVVDELPPAERARRAAELVGVFASAQATLEQLSRDADDILRDLAAHAVSAFGKPRASEGPSLTELVERPA